MRKMVQIKENEIVKYELPRNGKLSDGKYIFGYYRLAMDILLSEGWLPLEDVIPEYNENQFIIDDGYEILEDKVVKKYKVEDRPIVEPEIIDEYVDDEKVAMAEAIIDLEARLSVLEGGNV
jgi:hypothetical protein